MHLIIDGFGGDSAALDSEPVVSALLSELPRVIGMTPISGVRVLRYNAADPIDSGITGGIFIAESHIAIHTFPANGSAMVDIASCKPFDGPTALASVQAAFGFAETRHHVILRLTLPSLAGRVRA